MCLLFLKGNVIFIMTCEYTVVKQFHEINGSPQGHEERATMK